MSKSHHISLSSSVCLDCSVQSDRNVEDKVFDDSVGYHCISCETENDDFLKKKRKLTNKQHKRSRKERKHTCKMVLVKFNDSSIAFKILFFNLLSTKTFFETN